MPVWAIVLGAVVVAFLIWLLFIKGDDDNSSGSSAEPAQKTVTLTSAQGLPAEVAKAGYPVYWLGQDSGISYEVTLITDGRTYVRYLPDGVQAGSPDPYLTIGSYSQPNAFNILKGIAKAPGKSLVKVPDGGMAVDNGPDAQGTYVAYPGVPTQIEVYDPTPGRALRLAESGKLSQIG